MGCSASVNSPPETKKQTAVVKDAPLASRVTPLTQAKQATAWDKKMERRRSDAAKRQEKQTECGSGPGFNCAASEMQGKRPTMEDAHILNWGGHDFRVFACFDGHGGKTVADFAAREFVSTLQSQPAWAGNKGPALEPEDTKIALRQCFFALDERIRQQEGSVNCGCTAVVVLLTATYVVCANAGDSRCVIQSRGRRVKELSHDHKPNNMSERLRITSGGGTVCGNGRVNGCLAVSRALGDFQFKANSSLAADQQLVSAEPDIIVHQRSQDDAFIVLACDGVWDVMTSKACADAITKKMETGATTSETCEHILDSCSDLQSRDNMSILVVKFDANG